ncbi:MAG TPA: hypothetical protein PKW55_04290 [Spirochaetota bacterium]|nr:hypothetical protein [Spirochaetota bacterium]HOM37944.1 hypothetical protein [Spirochaetota bacterium]HPQ48748.1 hypothetical protein [Spirochaetota bacterium]
MATIKENGVSEKALIIKEKIRDKNYIDNAIKIISSQLVEYFFLIYEEE